MSFIIYGFADRLHGCANTLTADNFRAFSQVDDKKPTRGIVVQQVSGIGGAFDAFGESNFPPLPLTVTTRANIIHTDFDNVGDYVETMLTNLKSKGLSRLWFIPHSDYAQSLIRFSNDATGTITGTAAWDGSPTVGMRVEAITADGYIAAADLSGTGGAFSLVVPAGTYTVNAYYLEADLTEYNVGSVASVVVTVGGTTSGVTPNATSGAAITARWGWAKCISQYAVENAKNNRHQLPCVAQFYLPEGVVYGVKRTITKDEGDSTSFTLTMDGDYLSNIYIALLANSNQITSFKITNDLDGSYVQWVGTLAASKYLVIDSANRSVLYDASDIEGASGTNGYSGLTRSSGQVGFSYALPGGGPFTITVFQNVALNFDLSLIYYDTFIP